MCRAFVLRFEWLAECWDRFSIRLLEILVIAKWDKDGAIIEDNPNNVYVDVKAVNY